MADEDDEWRFSVDEVGEDADAADAADANSDDEGGWGTTVGEDDDGPTVAFGDDEVDDEADDGGNVAGAVSIDVPVESDTPELESAVFVAAGALLVSLVFASLFTQLTLTTIGSITLAITVLTGLLYAVFVRF